MWFSLYEIFNVFYSTIPLFLFLCYMPREYSILHYTNFECHNEYADKKNYIHPQKLNTNDAKEINTCSKWKQKTVNILVQTNIWIWIICYVLCALRNSIDYFIIFVSYESISNVHYANVWKESSVFRRILRNTDAVLKNVTRLALHIKISNYKKNEKTQRKELFLKNA